MRNSVNHGRRIKFFILLSLNLSCLILLSFQVHAVKSEVSLTERRIVSLDSELLILETEFQAVLINANFPSGMLSNSVTLLPDLISI